MKIRYLIILFGLLCILNACDKIENNTNDYTQYHSEIIAAETLISISDSYSEPIANRTRSKIKKIK